MNLNHYVLFSFSGLTQADVETSEHPGNGTSNGVDSDTENEKIKLKEEEEVKEEAAQVTAPQHVLTTFELEGLCNLLGKLEELPAHKKCVPAGIRNATALLEDMRVGLTIDPCVVHLHSDRHYMVLCSSLVQAVLKEHGSDNPKLSYTGEPIVKWPERVRTHFSTWQHTFVYLLSLACYNANQIFTYLLILSLIQPAWYQPPTPPPPVIYRPRLGPTLHKPHSHKPTKRSSINALRRRRVRCKRCAACCRKECGTCHYCHDMRKFGGPGRMKKSCIMRQCLAVSLFL